MREEIEKWFLMMDYCKSKRWPPAKSYFWSEAANAWEQHINQEWGNE